MLIATFLSVEKLPRGRGVCVPLKHLVKSEVKLQNENQIKIKNPNKNFEYN